MPPESPKVWADYHLIEAVNRAMDIFCDVFQLSRRGTSVYEFERVIARIRRGEFSPDERQRGTPVTPDDADELLRRNEPVPKADGVFYHDVFEAFQLPRDWDRLADALFLDFANEARSLVGTALSSRPEAGRPESDAVVRQVLHLLFWQVLLNGHDLVRKIEETESFYPWLQEAAIRASTRFARPSRVFENFTVLREVGDAWDEFRQLLGLPEGTRGYDREDIHKNRRERAQQLLGRGKDQNITVEEIFTAVPWPTQINAFTKTLMDPEETRDLHVVVRYYAETALRSRKINCPGTSLPEADDVANEFLDMKVWQAIKNARGWAREKRADAMTWAPRLFDANLLQGAFQAINYLLSLPANDPSGARQWAFDDLRDTSRMVDPKANHPIEILEPDQPVASSLAIKNRQQQWLETAINDMPAEFREVMRLYVGYSEPSAKKTTRKRPLTLDAISVALKISLEEVRTRLQSGTDWLTKRPRPRLS